MPWSLGGNITPYSHTDLTQTFLFQGPHGSVHIQGCRKSTCMQGRWIPSLRTDICCWKDKVKTTNLGVFLFTFESEDVFKTDKLIFLKKKIPPPFRITNRIPR